MIITKAMPTRKPPPPACRARFPQVRELRPDYAGPGISTRVTARQRPVNPASGEHPIPRKTRPKTQATSPIPVLPTAREPGPCDGTADPCPDVGSPALPMCPKTLTARCCTCVGTPRNAARSAIGTANGAGIGPAVDPGDPLAPVVGHVVDELVFAAGVAAGFPDEEQPQ